MVLMVRSIWSGAAIGLVWGAIVGFAVGFVFAGIANFSQSLRLRLLERQFRRQGLLNG